MITLVHCLGLFLTLTSANVIFSTDMHLLYQNSWTSSDGIPFITDLLEGRWRNETFAVSDTAVWIFDLTLSQPAGTILAGNGREFLFSWLRGAAHFNSTHILVTDFWQYCIKMIDSDTGQTSLYAGTPNAPGSDNGLRLNAKFISPLGIVQINGTFLVADYGGDSLRAINGDNVSTILKCNLTRGPAHITLVDDVVYCTAHYGVVRFNMLTPEDIILIAGSIVNHGYQDGTLLESRFWNPFGMISLSNSLLLLTDCWNNALRLIYLLNNQVFSVCLKHNMSDSTCATVQYPQTILKQDNYIYVVPANGFRLYRYQIEFLASTTNQESTTEESVTTTAQVINQESTTGESVTTTAQVTNQDENSTTEPADNKRVKLHIYLSLSVILMIILILVIITTIVILYRNRTTIVILYRNRNRQERSGNNGAVIPPPHISEIIGSFQQAETSFIRDQSPEQSHSFYDVHEYEEIREAINRFGDNDTLDEDGYLKPNISNPRRTNN